MSGERRILMIDDERSVYEGLRRSLRRLRPAWTCAYAPSLTVARQDIDLHGADMVVTDYAMPGVTGLDVVDALRADDHGGAIPVILLTGSTEPDLKRRALERGAADLLAKPVDPADLVARIENLLAEHDRVRKLEDREQELERLVRERTAELEATQLDIIFRLAILAEYRDETTGNHVIRVGTYSQLIAAAMGMDDRAQGELLLAAPLHDIGKVAIPDHVLLKRGRLLDSEWEIMRTHCRIGHEILTGRGAMESTMRSVFSMLLGLTGGAVRNPILDAAAEIAISHHERWDGRGYPNGLAETDIPLTGRIVAVADVFDALTSERSYKEAMSVEDAERLMRMERGRHFDPEVLDAFFDVLPAARETRTRLQDEGDRRNVA